MVRSTSWMATSLALAIAMLPACTSWKLEQIVAPLPPMAPAPANAAKICVVRTSVLAAAVTFPTRDDGVLVGATRGPGHFCYLAEPGEHDITIVADEPEHATLLAEPGHSYYLKQEVDNIFGYVKCRAVWVADSAARDAFDSTYYEALVGVPGGEALPDSPPFAPSRKTAIVAQAGAP
jgi:hypothetical protein